MGLPFLSPYLAAAAAAAVALAVAVAVGVGVGVVVLGGGIGVFLPIETNNPGLGRLWGAEWRPEKVGNKYFKDLGRQFSLIPRMHAIHALLFFAI